MKINSFLGIHNTNPPRSIPNNALVDAVDCNLNDVGAILRRPGSELSLTLPITSAFCTENERGFVVSGGMLNEVSLNPLNAPVISPLAVSSATEFSEWGNVLFTNDGLRVDGKAVIDLKLPTPNDPLEMSLATGDLPAGTYHATYTYKSANLESGSAPISSLAVPEGGGIYINPPAVVAGHTATVYLTDGNGTVYWSREGYQLPPVYELADPFPPCHKVAFHQNRLYCSENLGDQTVIRFSHVYYFHLFDYLNNILIVPGEVNAMMSTGEALIIATNDEIYAYNGTLSLLATYGVPKGKSLVKAPNGQVYIHSKRGICVAMPFQALTEKKASLPAGDSCCVAYLNNDGMNQVIALHNGVGKGFNPF